MKVGGTTAEAQVDKKCYRNQTAGWLGVVKTDHLGAPVGATVAPHGTVWLSETEAKLTARAPADAKDNPFAEQTFLFEDEKGERVEQTMRPLVLTDEDREVPDDRFVPAAHEVHEATAAEASTRGDTLPGDADRHADIPSSRPEKETLVPKSAGAVDPERHAPPEQSSWTDDSDRTVSPQQGHLSGSAAAAEAPQGDEAAEGGDTGAPPQAGVPQGVGAQAAGEEVAGVTSTGEETGAADQPEGDAPEGEFAQAEEVATPDAPTQGAT